MSSTRGRKSGAAGGVAARMWVHDSTSKSVKQEVRMWRGINEEVCFVAIVQRLCSAGYWIHLLNYAQSSNISNGLGRMYLALVPLCACGRSFFGCLAYISLTCPKLMDNFALCAGREGDPIH